MFSQSVQNKLRELKSLALSSIITRTIKVYLKFLLWLMLSPIIFQTNAKFCFTDLPHASSSSLHTTTGVIKTGGQNFNPSISLKTSGKLSILISFGCCCCFVFQHRFLWLSWNSPCRAVWTLIQRPTYLYLLNAGISFIMLSYLLVKLLSSFTILLYCWFLIAYSLYSVFKYSICRHCCIYTCTHMYKHTYTDMYKTYCCIFSGN